MVERVLPPRPGAGTAPAFDKFTPRSVIDRAERGASLRQQVQARQIQEFRAIMAGVNNQYDPSSTFGSGLQDFINVADLTRSRTLVDKINKFKDAYPEGQIAFIPIGSDSITLARKTPSEKFKKLGPLARISGGVISEPVIAGATTSAATAGIGTVPAALAVGGATALGEVGQSEIERARGFESRSRAAAVTEGVITGGATSLMEVLVRAVFGRALPVSALGRQAREVRLAQEFAERRDLPPLMAGQVSPSPLAVAGFGQAARADPLIMGRAAEQQAEARELLRSSVGRTSLTDAEVERTLQGFTSEIDDLLKSITPATKTEAGRAIQQGADDYRQLTFGENGYFARKYKPLVDQSDDFAYNIAGLKQTAAQIKLGTPAKATPKRGKGGQFETGGVIRLEGALPAKLQSVVDDIENLPTVISGFQDKGTSFTALEQLRAIRTRLFDMKFEGHAEQELINRLHRQVDIIMSSPLSGNKLIAQRFVRLSDQYRAAEDILERSYTRRALASDTPEKLLDFVEPGNFTALSEMKQIMRPEGWEVVRNNFKSELANDPSKIQATLAKWKNDPEGLRLLISRREEQGLLRLADLHEQLGMDVLNVALKRGTAPERRALQLIKADEESIRRSVGADGGADGTVGTALRSVLIEDLLEKATVKTKFGEVLSFKKFNEGLDQAKLLRKNNVFMRPEDWTELDNLDRYMLFSNAVDASNIGASLQVAEEVASAGKGIVPTEAGAKRLAKFAHFVIRQSGIARIMARPAARRGLAAAEATQRSLIEGLAIGGAVATRDVQRSMGLETLEEVERLGERGEMEVERRTR